MTKLILAVLLVMVFCICGGFNGTIRTVCDGPDDWHRSDENGVVQPSGTPFYVKDRT